MGITTGRDRSGFKWLAVALFALAGLAAVNLAVAADAGAKPAKKKQAKKKAKKNKGLKKAPAIAGKAPYAARGSIEDAYVTGAKPGQKLLLVNKKNRILRTGKADKFGSKIFYTLKPGGGYTVRTPKGKKKSISTPKFKILKAGANPPQSYYDKIDLHPGLNYVKMRDGIELAMTVRLPSGKTMADGPFPTFVEYSGYQTAAPHDLLQTILAQVSGGGTSETDPLAPLTSTAVGSLIGPLLDFATVSVQMRGSGCSGGAFDLFGLPTTYDGYDAIESVAAQDWVKGGMVGMGGISFSGITQLFTAGTQPPHLAAVSPLSVTDDVYQGTGFPGGIFNDGFAYSWITERMEEAKPAPAPLDDQGNFVSKWSQPWANIMSTTGDPDVAEPLRSEQKQHCLDNQKLRLQTRDVNKLIESNPYRTTKLFGDRSPGEWAKHINVPVFLVGQFQDEQTGGHWPELIKNLKKNPNVWVTLQNGVHVDSLGPSTITRWAEFMNLFVANRVPVVPDFVLPLGGELYNALASAGSLPIQQSRFADYTSSEQAMNDFKKDPRIRVLMDNGDAVPGDPGAIGAKWETHFSDWPVPSIKPTKFFLGKGGKLSSGKPGKGQASYKSDPKARPAKTLGPDGQSESWLGQPPYNWTPVAKGKGLAWVTPPMSKDTFIAGTSSLDLWLKSSKRNTDLQVTMTEVRPDGQETYVQGGWLRTSHRAIDKKASSPTDPVQTWLKKDGKPLKKGKFNYTRVQIFPVAHVFRAGSKIRIALTAPGGDRTIWNFQTIEKGKTRNTISFGGSKASKLVLPVIPGQDAQGTPLPGPTALRGEPSRDYVPASNGG